MTVAGITKSQPKGSKIRYARVLQGLESCGWCFMLASRGFVYRSEEAASHSHRGCKCIVMAGREGDTIEGHDLEGIQDRYNKIAEACGVDIFTDKDTRLDQLSREDYDRIARFAELRDPEWLSRGILPTIDYRYTSREEIEHSMDSVNLSTIDFLRDEGFKITPRPPHAIGKNGKVLDGVTNPDIYINNSEIWEIKHRAASNPGRKNGKLTFVYNSLHGGKKNFRNVYDPDKKIGTGPADKIRIILDVGPHEINATNKEIEDYIKKEMKFNNIDEVLVIYPDKSLGFYKK